MSDCPSLLVLPFSFLFFLILFWMDKFRTQAGWIIYNLNWIYNFKKMHDEFYENELNWIYNFEGSKQVFEGRSVGHGVMLCLGKWRMNWGGKRCRNDTISNQAAAFRCLNVTPQISRVALGRARLLTPDADIWVLTAFATQTLHNLCDRTCTW